MALGVLPSTDKRSGPVSGYKSWSILFIYFLSKHSIFSFSPNLSIYVPVTMTVTATVYNPVRKKQVRKFVIKVLETLECLNALAFGFTNLYFFVLLDINILSCIIIKCYILLNFCTPRHKYFRLYNN